MFHRNILLLGVLTVLLSVHADAQWTPTSLTDGRVRGLIRSGDFLFAATSKGVYRSPDGWGWTQLNEGLVFHIDPVSGGLFDICIAGGSLLVASDSGIYRSTDDGVSWSRVNATGFRKLCLLTNGEIVAGMGGYYGDEVARSTDNGESWIYGDLPWGHGWDDHVILNSIVSVGDFVYVSVSTYVANGGPPGIYRSPALQFGDLGWEWVSDEGLIRILYAASGPSDGNIYGFKAGPDLVHSSDGGVTWETILPAGLSASANCPPQNFAGKMYLPTTVGLLRLHTPDSTWENISGGTAALTQGVKSLLFDGNDVYVGTTNGGIWRETICDLNACGVGTSVDYGTAWNMVSYPSTSPNGQVSDYLTKAASSAFSYSGAYVPNPSLESGKGYWVKLDSSESKSYDNKLYLIKSQSIRKGWNMIGSIGVPFDRAGIVTEPSGITLSSLFWYNPEGGGYSEVSTIQPGRAYWVKASAAGTIIMDATQQ